MDAALFDLDGTLVDTPSGIVAILASMFPTADPADLHAAVGRPLTRIMTELLDHPDDSAVADACTRFRTRFSETVASRAAELLFPGVPELLEELRGRGIASAVVTSKAQPGAEEMVAAAGLSRYFDTVVGFRASMAGKPAPDQALLAADHLGVAPDRCVVIGDSVDDVAMARAAGMVAIGVSYGVSSTRALLEAGAVIVADSPAELANALHARSHSRGASPERTLL